MTKLWRNMMLGVTVVLIALVWVFVFGISSSQPGSYFDKGHNAVWLGSEWSTEDKSNQELQNLVQTLEQKHIDTVFVHAGPLNEDGSVSDKRYSEVNTFLERVRKFDANIKYQAWLGQIRANIDLDNPEVRHEIAKTSMTMTDVVGFDGVHFDIEPVWDGDLAFIETLEESRAWMSEDKKISVALAELIPKSLLWFLKEVRELKNYNSEENYENVAQHADQIVVMVYDTSIKKDWLYRWLVKEQTIRLTSLLNGTEVFIGIPAYEDENEAFNPEVENVHNALTGIVDGLNNLRSTAKNFAGVAIYRYEEIGTAEWQDYDNLWIK